MWIVDIRSHQHSPHIFINPPPSFTSFTFNHPANGRVTFTISGKFQVSLTLNSLSPTTTTSSTTTPPDPPSSPWTILDLKLLHASKLEEYPHIPVVLEKYQIQNLINIGQIKMAAAGEGTTATTTIDSSHSSSLPVKFPLVELYRYLGKRTKANCMKKIL